MRFWKNRDGAVLVEAALVIPVACIILFGGFEVARAIVYQHTIDTQLREATRYIARVRMPAADNEPFAENLIRYGVWGANIEGLADRLAPGTDIDVNLDFIERDETVNGVDITFTYVRIDAVATYNLFMFPIAGINPTLRFNVFHEQPYIGA